MDHEYLDNLELIAKKTKNTKVIRFFPESDLRCSHDGLYKIAKKNGIEVSNLNPGEFLVFANAAQSMLKIYAPGNIIAFIKHPLKHKIDFNVVRYIPRFFNGTEFNYDATLKKIFENKLEKAT